MSKLIITLDGVQVGEIPVDKDRITIGRRAENDIQLDHIAVSGQHAAVVTILNDSFLEDLGSTNGTVVNGGAVRKHFLRNGDLIEIGRHRLRYVGDLVVTREAADFEKTMVLNRPMPTARPAQTAGVRSATVTPWTGPEAPGEVGTSIAALLESEAVLHSRLTGAEAATATVRGTATFAAATPPALAAAALGMHPLAEQTVGLATRDEDPALAGLDPMAAVAAALAAARAGAEPRADAAREAPTALAPAAPAPAPAAHGATLAELPEAAVAMPAPVLPAAARAPEPAPVARAAGGSAEVGAALHSGEPQARLQVLNGTVAGRILEITKPLTTIGRPAVQVAVISRRSDGYYLAQVDGEQPARLNGAALVPHAVALHAHDILEIAGIKLEFFFQG